MDVRTDRIYAMVSAMVSAGDGIPYDFVGPQPPPNPQANTGVSIAQVTWLEMLRRLTTHIMSPSATLNSGGSAGSVALNYGTAAPVSGVFGMFQGVPFYLSGTANTLSAQPTSSISTASNQIRKVLVTLGMSALPAASSFALGGGTLQFVYGSAMTTSANACTSGGQALSYFDAVPLPIPSAGEIPLGWLNIPNSFATSAGLANSHMYTDFRATQGLNLSAMMVGLPQP